MTFTEPPHEPASRRWCDKHGHPFDVRPLVNGDRAALLTFYEEFEPKRGAQGLPPRGMERVKRWLDTILAHGIHLAALRERELIGHAFLVPTHAEGVSEYAIFLREDERGQGVGTELTRACIEAAREAGLRRLWLSVELQNRAAMRSYEKAGFHFLPGTIYSPEAEMELML
jgi:RimJ/RimL family protein N-acetyltransferase